MAKDTLTIVDNRTGKEYEIPIEEGGVIRAARLRNIKTSPDDFGLMSYDPAFVNTASCRSKVTFIDGDTGILRYRGYPIEELAEKSNYLEVAYLVVKGELPDSKHYAAWEQNIKTHTMVHENVKTFMEGFRYDAHPMGMLVGTIGALSTFYPGAAQIEDLETRRLETRRLIGKLPTLAAWAYRHSRGLPYVYPDNDLSYAGNFLSMLFKMTEQNCSANAMRSVGSSHVDPYSAVAAATAALYGPLHGGANEAVIRMLMDVGSVKNVPDFIKKVKAGERLMMGFDHRISKSYDPRAKIIKRLAYEVFEETGKNPLIDISLELERIALEDDYFVTRKLYPNVDFYTGVTYQAMGFPMTMFPVLFAIPRTSGWMAQWAEMVRDPEQKIARPRQVYTGEILRHWTPIEKRPEPLMREDAVSDSI